MAITWLMVCDTAHSCKTHYWKMEPAVLFEPNTFKTIALEMRLHVDFNDHVLLLSRAFGFGAVVSTNIKQDIIEK